MRKSKFLFVLLSFMMVSATALAQKVTYTGVVVDDQMLYWLVESVLADIRNGVMAQGSMWELANELMLRGNIDKAFQLHQFHQRLRQPLRLTTA